MSSMSSPLVVIFLTGLSVGFGHCIGMCGPIAVSLSLNLKRKGVVFPQLLYNAGRITTYAFLGGLMGLTGSFTVVASHIAGVQKGVMILAGVVIIIMGVSMLGWIPLGQIFRDEYTPKGVIQKGYQRLSASKSPFTYYPLGLLLGLLPCGPVYASLIVAARAGMEATSSLQGVFTGASLMLAFGIGTVPALFIVGKLAGLRWLRSREVIYQIGAVLMVVVGVYFVIRGVRY